MVFREEGRGGPYYHNLVIDKGKGFKACFEFTIEGVLGNNEGATRVLNLSENGL